MKTKHIRFTRYAAFALIAGVALPVPAFADLCQNPEVTINNLKAVDMDVRELGYWDDCDMKWRHEDVQNRIIPAGESTTYTDDLEYVGNCVITAFHLHRRVRQSNGAWGPIVRGGDLFPVEGNSVVCNTGQDYHLDNH